ncbi:Y-family DNA polymerase [Helcococcus bovis]|uniref:Y-family DNA polymerase n=1 Tax=Helcococcus bovis TaxID=3153252 RepID=UPI0038BC2DE6
MKQKVYIAIDLKSFYASVECVERGLDPLNTNLVVADASKTEKTICLAVTPSLKKLGLSGRSRLFEVVQKVKYANRLRRKSINWQNFIGKSVDDRELSNNPYLSIDYIAAPPRMAYYIEYSTKIFDIYLKYIAKEDIHVYSIDEVFLDVTNYLRYSKKTPREFAKMIILDILNSTGITATAGIGSNLYLAKVAMDIRAKHINADKDGVRIAELDEYSYRKYMWNHKPITDFWRVGVGYANRLKNIGLFTMGDIAKCSLGSDNEYHNIKLLFDTFGINAEILVDHAWGYEPVTIKDIKSYKPEHRSISIGQVMTRPYTYNESLIIIKEMMDLISINLIEKNFTTNHLTINIEYDIENIEKGYEGNISIDRYGRKKPSYCRFSVKLGKYTRSTRLMIEKVLEVYKEKVNKRLTIRKFNISADDLKSFDDVKNNEDIQISFLSGNSFEFQAKRIDIEKDLMLKEERLQKAAIDIKNKFGKNALLKAINLEESSTLIKRNKSIGGHKA